MMTAALFLQKSGQKDDIIQFERSANPNQIHVTYHDGNSRRHPTVFRFSIPAHAVSDYVSDILFGLRHDMEPFEYIQVTTAIGPSILYHVADISDPDIRSNIRTTVSASCNLYVRQIETSA